VIDAQEVMGWLQEVADPEIPVLSIVDLGIVREVSWDQDICVVTITPTYSGCPAMFEISRAIETSLLAHDVKKYALPLAFHPPGQLTG